MRNSTGTALPLFRAKQLETLADSGTMKLWKSESGHYGECHDRPRMDSQTDVIGAAVTATADAITT